MRHAKIVCTLGPASSGYHSIRKLVESGMDVARLNFSHGSLQVHRQNCEDVRRAARDAGRVVAILADLSGPKIRLGDLPDNGIAVQTGDELVFSTRPGDEGPRTIPVNYVDLPRETQAGDFLFVDDGRLKFEVISVAEFSVTCRTLNGGTIRSRKGLNIPNGGWSAPAISEKDRADVAFSRELGVDYIAQSFVRNAQDVREAKVLAGIIPVIAKIEKPQAVESFAEIAEEADGLMVARGDLGVEIGAEKVPLLQKRLILEMNKRAKPVIVATQMLESMVTNPRPTRAEVSDVANAVLDGADALMLSAESAAGQYPVEAVQTMASIIEEVERTALNSDDVFQRFRPARYCFDEALAHAAAQAAEQLGLDIVVAYSATGRSVAYLSACRPPATIMGFSPDPVVLSRMALRWGVLPIAVDHLRDSDAIMRHVESTLVDKKLAGQGTRLAVLLGLDVSQPAGSTTLKLWTVGSIES
jgi:pyruvate kinase